ncbi:hypothetical protein HBA55_13550 [Pseudomaricurvus alkylphenolicus]|jgi:hypothetical protein|uniref:hypothetical protein n=1 Tax=Pseudomaricurvus alkylphenolicus TaxID=1306991 RepID=UPI00141FE6FF|nr:hypothetical protein [Pseudomaricurvus alkylphenolicus]NIB40621.1 hypothetical protein [Pseudomaricurvus alkylphenolicus]
MQRIFGTTMLLSALIAFPAFAEPLVIKSSSTQATVLKNYTDKYVTLKLKSGQELSGSVKSVSKKLVHLHELRGREFFDAAVSLDSIEAVIVRVRDR